MKIESNFNEATSDISSLTYCAAIAKRFVVRVPIGEELEPMSTIQAKNTEKLKEKRQNAPHRNQYNMKNYERAVHEMK